MKNTILSLLFLIFSFPAFSQLTADVEYSVRKFEDNFEAGSVAMWQVTNNADNAYFIVKGHYELYRKNPKSADVIYPKWENKLEVYSLEAAFQFEKSKEREQYAGLILNASKTGALIAEIREDNHFRVRKIMNGKSSYVTGRGEDDGWISTGFMNKEFNRLQVKTSGSGYDFVINNGLQFSLNDTDFSIGRMGLLVGPGTKVSIDYFYVDAPLLQPAELQAIADSTAAAELKLKQDIERQDSIRHAARAKADSIAKAEAKAKGKTNPKTKGKDSTTQTTTAKAQPAEIKKLNEKIAQLEWELDRTRKLLQASEQTVTDLRTYIDEDAKRDYKEENSILKAANQALSNRNDSLQKAIETYEEVRLMLMRSESGDISAKLAEKLKEEKAQKIIMQRRLDELEYQNKKQSLTIKRLEAEVEELKLEVSNKK